MSAKEWKWGYINPAGEFIIAAQFHGAWDFHEGLAAVKIDWARGYINHDGEMVIAPQFEKAGPFVNGVAKVMIDGTVRYIDKSGNFVDDGDGVFYEELTLPPADENILKKYFEAGPQSEHLIRVKKTASSKWGYVNESGSQVIKSAFKQAKDFHEGLAAVLVAVYASE